MKIEDFAWLLREIMPSRNLSGDYLIFLDGDCIVGPNFLSRHARLAEAGYMMRGSRLMLSESYTAQRLLQILSGDQFPWRQGLQSGRLAP